MCPFCTNPCRDHCVDRKCGWVMCTTCSAFGIPGTSKWAPPMDRITTTEDEPQ